GVPGLGLRRLMIDEFGNAKMLLLPGQYKNLQTDRVILVPGPNSEITVIQRIFELFVGERKSESQIAAVLNREGILSDMGKPWYRATIHQVLVSEKYIGNNVYNRVSCNLKKKRVRNRPDKWIRAEGAFTPIVDKALFERARTIIDARSQHLSDSELLSLLREVLEQRGYLSGFIIDGLENLPSANVYRKRFGGLPNVYALIGYDPARDYRYIETNRSLRRRYPEMIATLIEMIRLAGANVDQDPLTDLLQINCQFTISLVLARAFATPAGAMRWKVRLDTGLIPDITIVVRMDACNEKPLDYYLLPSIDMTLPRLKFTQYNPFCLDAYRFSSLDFLLDLTRRETLELAA
ncbi:recombinase family protein, partial [Paraburkholderia aspalathi]|nr:recombinase family protein [Paraburkholderia aspalathi]